MVTPELLDYIRYQRNLGKNDDVIRDELLRKKFDEIDVDKALAQVIAEDLVKS